MTFAAADEALLSEIAAEARLRVEDTLRVALWSFGRHLGIDVPPKAFAVTRKP